MMLLFLHSAAATLQLWGAAYFNSRLHLSSEMLAYVVFLMKCQEEELHICELIIRIVVFSFKRQGKRLQE